MVQKKLLFCIGLVLALFAGKAALGMEVRGKGEREAREENQELVLAQLQERVVGPDKMFQEVLRMRREEYRKLFEMTEVFTKKQIIAAFDEPAWEGGGIAIRLERLNLNKMLFCICDGRYRVFIPVGTRDGFVSNFLSNPLSLQTIRMFSFIKRDLITIHKLKGKRKSLVVFKSRDYPGIGEYPEIKELISLLLKILADKVLHSHRVRKGVTPFEKPFDMVADMPFWDVEIVCIDEEN